MRMVYIDWYFIHTALIAAFFRISDDVTHKDMANLMVIIARTMQFI